MQPVFLSLVAGESAGMNSPSLLTTEWPSFRGAVYSLGCAASLCAACAADKKFIELGWDMPDTTFLLVPRNCFPAVHHNQ